MGKRGDASAETFGYFSDRDAIFSRAQRSLQPVYPIFLAAPRPVCENFPISVPFLV